MNRALREHWPEYLFQATALGIFMISAGVFTALFEYPGASGDSRSVSAADLYRHSDGTDTDRSNFFAAGEALWSTHESGGHADLFAVRQNEAVGRVLLRCVAVHRRPYRGSLSWRFSLAERSLIRPLTTSSPFPGAGWGLGRVRGGIHHSVLSHAGGAVCQ